MTEQEYKVSRTDIGNFNISFVGKEYNFTYLAATKFFNGILCEVNYNLVSCQSLKEAFTSVDTGSSSYAVLPLESSSHGTIHNVYDKLLSHHDIVIVGEIGSLEQHHLVSKHSDIVDTDVDEVIAHPHILECCTDYLDVLDIQRLKLNKLPILRTGSWDSAAACIQLNELTSYSHSLIRAAISSGEAALHHKLRIIKSGIGNDQNAETRYIILGKFDNSTNSVVDPFNISASTLLNPKSSRKASIALALRNIPGALFKMSSCFALRDIDIHKIESRPATTAMKLSLSKNTSSLLTTSSRASNSTHLDSSNRPFSSKHWDLIFYVDYEPSSSVDTNKALLENLREYSLWIRELGSYNSGLSSDISVKLPNWSSVLDVMSIC